MKIGILRESQNDKRVALTPDTVKQLILQHSVTVHIESNSKNIVFSDDMYTVAGARATTREDVLRSSDIIVGFNPLSIDDIKKLTPLQVVIAQMNPFFNPAITELLASKKITSFSMELVPRTTRAQSMDVLSSMATVSGYRAVLDAAMHLPKFFPMIISPAGTIKPAKVLVLGAGVAGLQAIALARRLGAVVEVFDVRSAVKEEVLSLGGKFIEVAGAEEDVSAGGYAIEQTDEFKARQAQLVHDHALVSDVVICTAQIPGRKAPVLLKKETISLMKPGSVVIDLAASTGGNSELTKNGETIEYQGVTIIGNSEYPAGMPADASVMFSKNIFNFLKLLINEKGIYQPDFGDEIVRGTCLTHKGEIMNEKVKQSINK